MNKFDHKWIRYHELHHRHRNGMTPPQIASFMGMDTRTVKKLLEMSEQEYLDFQQHLSTRSKKLAPYEDYIKSRLEQYLEASSAQVHDWLKEHYPSFPNVSIKSVYNFVLYVRNKYQLLKIFDTREYSQVEQLPYGQQAQVDFGEYNMTDVDGQRKKVYFFAIVLSRSRYKFVFFSEHPFISETAIAEHEDAFVFFDGYPHELVYDQDKVLLVNENKGDLIFTEAFRAYCQSRPFKVRFCRKSDPQSKGKIENVIKYIKYNFLRGRIYYSIPALNDQAIDWLGRTANAKVHSTTLKIPTLEWELEKAHLIPLKQPFAIALNHPIYNVTKDNVIHFKGSSYSVPDGTFQKPKTEVFVSQQNDCLIISNIGGEEIARHEISLLKGQQVRNNNHRRDHSKKVMQLIVQVTGLFSEPDKATEYLENIHKQMPRYARDQINMIASAGKKYTKDEMDQTLTYCLENNLPKAADFEPVLLSLRQAGLDPPQLNKEALLLQNSKYKIKPQTSSISDYKQIFN
jgi:Integrase core domain